MKKDWPGKLGSLSLPRSQGNNTTRGRAGDKAPRVLALNLLSDLVSSNDSQKLPTSHVLASRTRKMRKSFMTIFISKHGVRNSALYSAPISTPPDTYLLVVKPRDTGWPILGVLRNIKRE